MSRTYRTHLEWKLRAYGRDWSWEEERKFIENVYGCRWFLIRLGWKGYNCINKKSRDRKPWDKPSRDFKGMKRRIERSKVKAAVRNGKDIPEFRKSDQYDWT
jgi:hypothetical protein